VAVVGVKDEEWGERIAAVVVPAGAFEAGPLTEALRAYSREHLRSSKTPDEIVFRTELPYSPTGKLLRRTLRQELAGQTV
jgi:acyl-CoA synthetase (AMP-forming)/AMP-acid ligase II